MPNPLAVALIAQGVGQGINYLANRSAQKDMDKASKRQEEEQSILDAIAAFRGTSPSQARVAATPSGTTRGLSILAQLAPLATQYGINRFGGSSPNTPNTPNAQTLSAPERNLRSRFMLG
tara:strand:+ start:2496 stop:2855 length:360 start_codon:yes stop_codon:yes gene_type:complete